MAGRMGPCARNAVVDSQGRDQHQRHSDAPGAEFLAAVGLRFRPLSERRDQEQLCICQASAKLVDSSVRFDPIFQCRTGNNDFIKLWN